MLTLKSQSGGKDQKKFMEGKLIYHDHLDLECHVPRVPGAVFL